MTVVRHDSLHTSRPARHPAAVEGSGMEGSVLDDGSEHLGTAKSAGETENSPMDLITVCLSQSF